MKIIHLATNGDAIIDPEEFESSWEAWASDFDNGSDPAYSTHPVSLLVSSTGKTIVDAPYELMTFIGKRVTTVCKAFKAVIEKPEAARADVDTFIFLLNR